MRLASIILAGGYARRLWPLTKNMAKPLLRVGRRPVIDYIYEKVIELGEVNRVIISTNLRFKKDFEDWARSREAAVEIICDNSTREEEKPGAVRALAKIASKISEDMLVVAGDNLFTSSLSGMLEEFVRRKAPIVALYDVENTSLAKHYSTVKLNHDGRILSMVEKPKNPDTSLIGTCIYLLPSTIRGLLLKYVEEDLNADSPGNFISWLAKLTPVYGYLLDGEWFDVGTPETLRKARERFGGP